MSMINPGYIQTKVSTKGVKSSYGRYGQVTQREYLTPVQLDLLAGFEAKYLSAFATSPTPLATSEAIHHALADPKPRTRYNPGSIGMGSIPRGLYQNSNKFCRIELLTRRLSNSLHPRTIEQDERNKLTR